jgi:hypothetical protein
MADVSAKDGSQETLVQLGSLLFSLLLMQIVTGNQLLIWTLFVLFTFVHLFANYHAVTAVTMETFNQSRLHIVVSDWLSRSDRSHVVSVKTANLREPVLYRLRRYFDFNLGCSLAQLLQSNVDVLSIVTLFSDSKYLLMINTNKVCVDIVLGSEVEWRDQLMACYHAEVIDYCFMRSLHRHHNSLVLSDDSLLAIIDAIDRGDMLSVVSQSYKFVAHTFETFCDCLMGAGWKCSPVQLCADEWRAHWHSQGLIIDSKKLF